MPQVQAPVRYVAESSADNSERKEKVESLCFPIFASPSPAGRMGEKT